LYGLGVNSVGSIYTDFDTNSWAGPVVLASNTRVQTLNGVCRLSFTGPITGPGGLDKIGEGTLNFSGTSSNRYAGITTVSVGKLELSKTNATAIPGPLTIGDNVTPTNNATVQSLRINQIEDTAPVVVNSSGTLSFDPFNAPSETIGSLAGAGHVNLMLTALTLAGNADSTFDGVISGFNAGQILKTGYGVWTLNGTNNSIGATFVNAGKIVVNGASVGPLQLNFFSALGGTGVVGDVSGTLAKIAPGNSVGRITTGNLMLINGSSSLDVQLNGTNPGSGYDQILVNGGVNLTNPTLNVSMTFPGAVGNQYVIIANDFSDAINGTFKNLPEGTNFLAGGAQFQITYKGGDGNDVVLTQMTVPTPSQIGGITALPNGQIGLSGSGSAGASYDIEANLDLGTTNWVKLGTVQAGQNGAISFIDLDAPNHAMRFYRFKAQ
jgi:autotransporter-associated beta strand protein